MILRATCKKKHRPKIKMMDFSTTCGHYHLVHEKSNSKVACPWKNFIDKTNNFCKRPNKNVNECKRPCVTIVLIDSTYFYFVLVCIDATSYFDLFTLFYHDNRRQMPPSPRSHRPGLSSIDDDNWEEDPPDAVPASHRGRTIQYPRGSYDQQQPYSFDPYQVHYGRENVARAPPPDRRSGRRHSARPGESSSDSVLSSRLVGTKCNGNTLEMALMILTLVLLCYT